jgi:hypothetical protein
MAIAALEIVAGGASVPSALSGGRGINLRHTYSLP